LENQSILKSGCSGFQEMDHPAGHKIFLKKILRFEKNFVIRPKKRTKNRPVNYFHFSKTGQPEIQIFTSIPPGRLTGL